MEVLIPLIQKGSISHATKAVKNIIEDLQKRNKLIKIADKSPALWNTVQGYLSDDLASDSENNKKLKAAEARALRKQKTKVKNNSVSSFRQINSRDETLHSRQSFRPKTFRHFKYDNQANIQQLPGTRPKKTPRTAATTRALFRMWKTGSLQKRT